MGRASTAFAILLTCYRRLLLAPPASSSAVTLEPIIARRTITLLITANPPLERELPPAPLTAVEVTLRFEALQPPNRRGPARSVPSSPTSPLRIHSH